MRKILLSFFLLFATSLVLGQNFSNKGKDFWVGYGYHVRMAQSGGGGNSNSQEMVLYFATDQITTVTISIPATGYTETLTSGSTPTILTSSPIPKTGAGDVRLTNESTAPENKGIHITADKPIVAYAHIYNSNVSGATILFPTNTLGKEYYSINYTNNSNEDNSNCWFYVLAADTGTTTVEITPSANTLNHTAGIPFTVNLTQGQVYNIMGQLTGPNSGVDLTGSKIRSIASGTGVCKRIAVFSGSGKISISCANGGGSSADNYMVQAFPKDAWGRKFLTTPTVGLTNNIYRICVSDPATIVRLNNSNITYPLINNFYYEIPANSNPQLIESNLPITVTQYITTTGACNNPNTPNNLGDPEVIYLSPVEQNISKVIWNATNNFQIAEHYFNVIIPNRGTAISSFKLDGVSVNPTLFITHPYDANYSYLSIPVPNSGAHIIESDSGFNAIAYGYGSRESYGYNAGTNILDLYNFIQPINPVSTVNTPLACIGTPFKYSITLPFQPTFLNWNFYNNPSQIPSNNVNVNAPVYDSTYFIGTKQVWRYKLPTSYRINVANTSPGYLVTVSAGTPSANGCGNSIDKDFYFQVFETPSANFYYTSNGCNNDSIKFYDSTIYQTGVSPYKFFWDFGDGTTDSVRNPRHLYLNGGTYNIKFVMISNVGCLSDTVRKTITLTRRPIVNISTSTPICAGKTISFNPNINFTGWGSVASCIWDFGDGIMQTLSPTNFTTQYTYINYGNYIPAVRVTTNSGCVSNTDTNHILVGAIPKSGFISPKVCLDDAQADFIDTSYISFGSISTWSWNFGDPSSPTNTSTIHFPSHKYNDTGLYQVTLITSSNVGCKDTLYQSFYVNGSTPHADFQILRFDTLCANNIVQLKDLSTVIPGYITQAEIIWDYLGAPSNIEIDNNPYFGKIYQHLYPDFHNPSSKPYQVKFIAHTGASTTCIDDFDNNITIHASPDVSFKPTMDTCLYINPFPITLANELSGLPGSFNYYGVGLSPTNYLNTLIPGPGIDTITCTYTSTAGCIDTAYQKINIYAPPVANFGFTQPVCKGKSIQFRDSSTIPLGSIVTWIWDFDDGSPIYTTNNNAPFTHIYYIAKNYTVKLTVISNTGCTSLVKQKTVLISPFPVSNFIHTDTACLPEATVYFRNTCTIPDNTQSLFTYLWNFNDPISGSQNTSTLPNPSHTYRQLGSYQVKLTVTSNAGCADDTTITIDKIYPRPNAFFAIEKKYVCLGETIKMYDSSVANAGYISSWHWKFDDGDSSQAQHPSHTYADSGNYLISLYIITNLGCLSDTMVKPFLVYPLPKISAGPDMRIIEEIGAPLQATALGNKLSYLWTSDLYLNNATILNPVCSPKEDIIYTLTVTGEGGCISTDEMKVTALKTLKIPNAFSPNGDGINDYWLIGNSNIYVDARIQVFTRTGQLVYESKGLYKPWDGKKAGKTLPTDTYYYILEPGDGRKPMTGFVHLIR